MFCCVKDLSQRLEASVHREMIELQEHPPRLAEILRKHMILVLRIGLIDVLEKRRPNVGFITNAV